MSQAAAVTQLHPTTPQQSLAGIAQMIANARGEAQTLCQTLVERMEAIAAECEAMKEAAEVLSPGIKETLTRSGDIFATRAQELQLMLQRV